MKRFIVLTLAAVFFFSFTSRAQLILGGGFGVNMTTITNLNSDNKVVNGGVQADIMLGVPICNRFDFITGISLSQRGEKVSQNVPFFGQSSTAFNTNYLEVPFLAEYHQPLGNTGLSLYGHLGPMLSFWTCANTVVRYGDDRERDSYDFDNDGNVRDNRFEVGLKTGVGVQYPVGCGQIGFGYNFSAGLTTIQKYEDGRPNGVDPNRNIVHSLSMRYIFSPSKNSNAAN